MLNYQNFLREKGMLLSEMFLESNEIALTVNDAMLALDILHETHIAVLGGDILSEKEIKHFSNFLTASWDNATPLLLGKNACQVMTL